MSKMFAYSQSFWLVEAKQVIYQTNLFLREEFLHNTTLNLGLSLNRQKDI